MLEQRPVTPERLVALGVFSGIAIAAVAGFELVISGSLAPLPVPAPAPQPPMESYPQRREATPAPRGRPYAPTAYLGSEAARPDAVGDLEERLLGGPDDASAPDGPGAETLLEDITRTGGSLESGDGLADAAEERGELGAESETEAGDAFREDPAPAPEDAPDTPKGEFSASGSASPW